MEKPIPKREMRMGAMLPPMRITAELKKRMQQYTTKHGISIAELQRRALLEFLDREGNNGNRQAD